MEISQNFRKIPEHLIFHLNEENLKGEKKLK
jgi:hypothetical protein